MNGIVGVLLSASVIWVVVGSIIAIAHYILVEAEWIDKRYNRYSTDFILSWPAFLVAVIRYLIIGILGLIAKMLDKNNFVKKKK